MAGPDLYVQVPAYRDAELGATLRDLYARSARPERMRVRVMWQRGADERLPADVLELPGLELDEVPAAESHGCNWARRRLQTAWAGERYTLLLDSHHRFVPGWDDAALAMLEGLRDAGVAKPMLTAYLPAYHPDEEGYRREAPQHLYPYRREAGVLTRLRGGPLRSAQAPVPADFASLHFILCDGAFNAEVPADPAVYFFGDEVLTSVRAFAAGYRLFHPHRVLGWHAYDRRTRVTHWADQADGPTERERQSLVELRRWFAGERAVSAAAVAAFEDHVNLRLVMAA